MNHKGKKNKLKELKFLEKNLRLKRKENLSVLLDNHFSKKLKRSFRFKINNANSITQPIF